MGTVRGELTPSQPPPSQGEEQNEDLLSTAEQFPPLLRGGLGWGFCGGFMGSLAPTYLSQYDSSKLSSRSGRPRVRRGECWLST